MAILVKGTDFVDGEQITSAKLDNLVDNATFASGSVESGGGITLNGSGQLKIAGNIDIGTSNLTATGTISLGATSFNDNNITNVGSIALDTITNDGTDVTIDSSGDIILDSDGAQIRIKDDGTERFVFNTDATPELDVTGGDFTIHANTSDADILFVGNDGGSTITALQLDMSAAGAATFNDKITAVGTSVFTNLDISGDISVTGSVKQSGNTGNLIIKGGDTDGANIELYGASHASHSNDAFYDADSHSFRLANGASTNVIINSSGSIGIGTASPAVPLDVNGQARVVGNLFVGTDDTTPNGMIEVYGGGGGQNEGGEIRLRTAADFDSTYNHYFIDAYQDDLRIGREGGADITLASDGNVGIGTTSPAEKLEVVGNAMLDASNAKFKIKAGGVGTTGELIFTFNTDSTKYAGIDFAYDTRASVGPRFWSADGYDLTVDSGDDLHLQTDGTDRLTILNAGNVGIGMTPSYKLDVSGEFRVNGGGSGSILVNDEDSSLCPTMTFLRNGGGTTTNDFIKFENSGGEVAAINTTGGGYFSGNVGIGTASPAEKLDVVGAGRFSTGVTFGTDTAAANKLDDYEEGTWTPAITFGGGNTGVAYSYQVGTYTKIGDLVTASCYMSLSSKGSSTGAAVLKELPFTSRNLTANLVPAALRLSNISFADFPMGWNQASSKDIHLQETTNAGTTTSLTDANFSNSSEVMISISYRV